MQVHSSITEIFRMDLSRLSQNNTIRKEGNAVADSFASANPDYRTAVESIFSKAEFVRSLGIELVQFGPGWCETRLVLQPRHLQQDGYAHAGVVATIADHTAGAAAGSLVADGNIVLTVEYKINLLRPGVGDAFVSRADVLRNGKRIIVCESSVYALRSSTERPIIAKGLFTLAVVPSPVSP